MRQLAVLTLTLLSLQALQDAGIRGLSVEDLIRFRIHKVTPDYIKGMHVDLAIHGPRFRKRR